MCVRGDAAQIEGLEMCTYCGGFDAVLAGLCADCVREHVAGSCESRPGACDACAVLGVSA